MRLPMLVTAVAAPEPREGGDFLPLTVEYKENLYSAGRIPAKRNATGRSLAAHSTTESRRARGRFA